MSGPRWFQLYWSNERRIVESFVRRAEAAGYGAIVVTVDTFIPGWKPRDLQQAWLPFLQGMGVANFFAGPGLPRGPREAPGGGRRRRDRPFPRRLRQPLADLGRPRLAARADLAADPGQGHPACRRRPRSGVPRPRRDRRLQPRRPPGRRRDRLARRPWPDRRGGRRRPHGPLRQRHPQRQRRHQGARPRRRRRPPRPPLHLGPRPRGPAGRRNGPQDDPRRPRPDDGPLRLHRARPDRPRGAGVASARGAFEAQVAESATHGRAGLGILALGLDLREQLRDPFDLLAARARAELGEGA